MKRVIFLLLCSFFVVNSALGQSQSEYGVISKVVECEATKSALWINLKTWVSGTFTSYKHTVDLEDKDSGTLILKFNSTSLLGAFTDVTLSSTLKVEVRENKYRYTISDAKYEIKPNDLLDGNLSYMSTSYLEKAQAELEAAKSLSYSTNIDSNFKSKLDEKTQKVAGIPQFLSEKDKNKDRENPAYTEANTELKLMKSVDTNYNLLIYEIKASLEKSMNTVDDF